MKWNRKTQHCSVSARKQRLHNLVKSTNLDERRLASADRNNKATLLLTALPRTIKSSAKDSSQRKVKLQYVDAEAVVFPTTAGCQPATIQGQRPIRIQLRCAGVEIIAF